MNRAPLVIATSNNTLRPLSVFSRWHSHTVYSAKPKVPKLKPLQKTYDIQLKNEPGGLKGWTDWAMKKDHRKRKIVVQWGRERQLVETLINSKTILPREIVEEAVIEEGALPKYSNPKWTISRCAISSRGVGVRWDWRLSRFFFRHLADYNKMAGVQRGIW